jgi:hypothetical protein
MLFIKLENKAKGKDSKETSFWWMNEGKKGAIVEGMELTLRDPSFARILHIPNILEEWTKGGRIKREVMFPLKANAQAASVKMFLLI